MNKLKILLEHLADWQKLRIQKTHTSQHTWSYWLPTPSNVIFTLLMIIALLATQNVWAGALQATNMSDPGSTTINYQGRLADSIGNPLNGEYAMSFILYDAATGGNILWGPEEHPSVPISEGLFSISLGSQTSGGIPTDVWNGDSYLEITVGGETLSPRELIRSVPVAGMALTVPDGVISPSKLESGTTVNRYYIAWFDSESPCTTSNTSWTDCGNTLGGGFKNNFPPPAPGTTRQYRLLVANADNLSTSGNAYVRIVKRGDESSLYEFELTRRWSWADYQVWEYSDPLPENDVHLELQIRLSIPEHTLWLYRVWVMAEDVIP